MRLVLNRNLTSPYSPERRESMSHTYAGQASWALTTSPHTCRECDHWGTEKVRYDAVDRGGELKPVRCYRRTSLMAGVAGSAVPHDARACSQFVANPNPPDAISVAKRRSLEPKKPKAARKTRRAS